MPKITGQTTVEQGYVIGFIKIDGMIDPEEFIICLAEEWETLNNEQGSKKVRESLNESDLIQVWY